MKNVLIFGFTQNQAVFLTTTVRTILGACKITIADEVIEIINSKEPYDVICINAAMHYWQMDYILTHAKQKIKDFIMGLSLQSVPQKNMDILLHHDIKYILFNLQHEEEINTCKQAVLSKKMFHSKGSIVHHNYQYENCGDIYRRLSKKQKCAFHYMMSGKSLKEFYSDFNFNALSTASSHWSSVLKKYQVHSVIQLRNKF